VQFQELVRSLAQQLEPVLPGGVLVHADGRNIVVHTRHGWDGLNVVDNIDANMVEGATAEEAVKIAVANNLRELQDVVTEHLTVPWPQRAGMKASEFVDPEVEIVDGVLHVWFGERLAPVFPRICIEIR
jgi:hypothetical protein